MNVSLTPELEKYVRRKVATGLYNNASEVIREALRLLVSREAGAETRAPQATPRKGDVLARLAGLEKALRDRGIQSAALFGSVVRGTARADSDIDVLVDVTPGSRFSLVDMAATKDFLEKELGRSVDLVTREGLNPDIRVRVLREAERAF
jgi:putative addiction module CopG family antidote